MTFRLRSSARLLAPLLGLALLAGACAKDPEGDGLSGGRPATTTTGAVDVTGTELVAGLIPFTACDELLRHLQTEAADRVEADAHLLNCSPPEQVTAALPLLRDATDGPIGAYANAFHGMPKGWKGRQGDALPEGRTDMGVERYAEAVRHWVELGADIVGGCCEIGPEYIAHIASELH